MRRLEDKEARCAHCNKTLAEHVHIEVRNPVWLSAVFICPNSVFSPVLKLEEVLLKNENPDN